jgi:flavin-dependent dehydrogenase
LKVVAVEGAIGVARVVTPEYDVALVGAGPAGSASATLLARTGLRVVLLDRARFPRDKACAENLSPAAEPILRDLGVLDAIAAGPVGRIAGFRVYAPGGRVFQGDYAGSKDATGRPLHQFGLVVPRLRLDAALLQAARAAGATVREGWRVGTLTRCDADPAGGYRLTAASGQEEVTARLLIAADGAHSMVARRLGLAQPGRLRKIGLVAHMRGISGIGSYTEMHVAGRRYVGIAPLESPDDGDLCNVAMVVDEARDGRAVAGRTGAYLTDALATFPGLRDRLTQATIIRPVMAVSRLHVRARRLSASGVLLVGDAAGYYDPFTGEGLYRALRSAQLAAAVAADVLAYGHAGAHALARYDRLMRVEFRGKRAVEAIIQAAVQFPPLMDHVAYVLGRRKALADTIVGVTGDFLPASAVLRPGFLLRLV